MTSAEDTISKYLSDFEKSNPGIEIILAVEAGSRAWGFNSKTSDYDIRFIYRYTNPRRYITTSKRSDTLNADYDDGLYDFHGWEIQKALQLLKQSNSSILEWLHTPIVYLEKYQIKEQFLKILSQMHTNKSLIYHYYNMGLRNYRDRIEGHTVVTLKKYTYVIRPLGMVDWLMRFPTKSLTIDFNQILVDLEEHIPSEQFQAIQKFIHDRRNGKLPIEGDPIDELDRYIKGVLAAFDDQNNRPQKEINLQGTNNLYQKVQNCYTKIQAILRKHAQIDRSEYLSIIGFILQYKWLRLHPEKNFKDVPSKIGNLLKDVPVSVELSDFIKLISVRDRGLYFRKTVPDDDKYLQVNEWLKLVIGEFLGPVIDSIRYIDWTRRSDHDSRSELQDGFSSELLKFLNPHDDNHIGIVDSKSEWPNLDELPRDDFVEYILAQWIPSILWMIENSDSPYSRIPKQPLDALRIDDSIRETIRVLIKEHRVTYQLEKVDELHSWIEEFLEEEKSQVQKDQETQLVLKQERTKVAYNHSMKDLDDGIFDDLLWKMTIDFKAEV